MANVFSVGTMQFGASSTSLSDWQRLTRGHPIILAWAVAVSMHSRQCIHPSLYFSLFCFTIIIYYANAYLYVTSEGQSMLLISTQS